jgi:plasmid stabilization system protein ParE
VSRRRYELAPEARQQLEAIGDYIAEDSIGAALKVLDALEESFGVLAENPGIGHTREDLTDRPVKFWRVFSYLVIYNPASNPLEIISVVHGARDVGQLLKNIES